VASKNTSILSQELEPLNAQIKQLWGENDELETELRSAEAKLEAFSADNQQFEALRDVCNALDKLGELDATELFWNEVPGSNKDGARHVERLRNRIIQYEAEIQSNLEEQNSIKVQIDLCFDELDALQKQVDGAYIREQLRQEEFIVEREISPIPSRPTIMPWANDSESESLFRRSLLIALLLTFIFGSIIPLVNVPAPDPMAVVKVPERIAMLLKKEPPKPEPVPEQAKKEKEPEEDLEKPKPTTEKTKAARKKVENTGVLAFKSSFADLMDETPIAKLGSEARLSKASPRATGSARGRRSLVAMASGSSGGIGSSAVSRNIGSSGGDRIAGVGFARVASSLAGMQEEAGRPVSDGPGPARTDEEIQIVFDRYKALLYRIYNKELRKNPTLRGKILLRITIEPDGTVSLCKVESTDLASAKLVDLIVARVKRFNFGPKDDVPKTTILYPIDFLPAG
jgi:outer membrane biosynthesis protein TonB